MGNQQAPGLLVSYSRYLHSQAGREKKRVKFTNLKDRAEILDIIRKLCTCDYETEEEGDNLLEELERRVTSPEASDIIFYGNDNDTPENMLEKMLAYKPIILPDRSHEIIE